MFARMDPKSGEPVDDGAFKTTGDVRVQYKEGIAELSTWQK